MDEDGDMQIRDDYENPYERQDPYHYQLNIQPPPGDDDDAADEGAAKDEDEDKPNFITTEEVFERDDIQDYVTKRKQPGFKWCFDS